MNDLISRQDALDALATYIHHVDRAIGTGKLSDQQCVESAHSIIDEVPSAEPEIIRCKDCKYWEESFPFDLCMLTKAKNNIWRSDETDFCSWAERREEE